MTLRSPELDVVCRLPGVATTFPGLCPDAACHDSQRSLVSQHGSQGSIEFILFSVVLLAPIFYTGWRRWLLIGLWLVNGVALLDIATSGGPV